MPRIDFDAIEDEWEEDHHLQARRSRDLSVAARRRIDEYGVGRVVAVDRGRVTVLYDGDIVEARLGGTMRGEVTAVGDWVRVRPPRDRDDDARVVEVLPRRSVLTRTPDDALDEERVVVANADQVVVVVAADYLEGGVGFLDRVLVAAGVGGLEAVVCVNKVDLAGDDQRLRRDVDDVASRYAAIGLPVVQTSALTGAGVDGLLELLTGCWTAFSGHSGVGKSRLFNRMVPGGQREVGDTGRYGGRHTTTSSRAMHIPALDAWLVDTPGVRSFGLGNLDARDLARYFPELADLDCELPDCTHAGEPGCALSDDAIHPARLASYQRLLAAVGSA